MENASKALIIAGAILISILIIGLGVYIYTQASSTVKKANLSSQEALAQNGQFTSYFGTKVSAAEVKQMLSLVTTNNITASTADEAKAISICYQASDTATPEIMTPSTLRTTLKSKYTYTVDAYNELADDEEAPAVGATLQADKTAAYYSSGYIKIIKVVCNTSATGGNASN